MPTLPNATKPAATAIATIETAALKVIDAVREFDKRTATAATALEGARGEATSQREALLIKLASMSAKAGWVASDIDAGVKAAIKSRTSNDANAPKDTSLATWAGEIRNALLPQVRDTVAPTFALATELWNAERAAAKLDNKAARPLQVAFARRYHVATKLLRTAADNKPVALDAASVIAYAQSKAPVHDAAKVAARLRAITAKLKEFAAEYPHKGISACVDYLDDLDAKKLKAARGDTAAPKAPVVPKAPSVEAVAGASDVLDDLDATIAAI